MAPVVIASELLRVGLKARAVPDRDALRHSMDPMLLPVFVIPSSFALHIEGIFLKGAEEQMIGIYTGGIVTSVAAEETLWNRTMHELIRKARGNHSPPIEVKSPIALLVPVSHPEPASIGLLHFGPESLFRTPDLVMLAGEMRHEMVRPYTRGISAILADQHPIGDRSIDQLVNDSWDPMGFAIEVNQATPTFVVRSSP